MSENTQDAPKPFEYPAQIMQKANEPGSNIILHNLDVYKKAIGQFKEQMFALVQDKTITDQVATRIVLEQEYSMFQQIVQIELKTGVNE